MQGSVGDGRKLLRCTSNWNHSDGGESPGSMFRSGKLLGQQVRKAGEGGRTVRGAALGILHVILGSVP